ERISQAAGELAVDLYLHGVVVGRAAPLQEVDVVVARVWPQELRQQRLRPVELVPEVPVDLRGRRVGVGDDAAGELGWILRGLGEEASERDVVEVAPLGEVGRDGADVA